MNINEQARDDAAKVILHIGIGAFHRAHQAWYLHRLIEQEESRSNPQDTPPWSLTVGNIRPDLNPLLTELARQHGRYTLETVTPAGERHYETVTSIRRVLPWDAHLSALIEAGAAPATRIISFTVTEGGYYLDHTDRLDLGNPDLQADLGGARTTIYGALGAILRARMQAGSGPLTLLNCDNLRSNGERFRAGFLEFLERRGETDLRDWVGTHTSCPNSMVDRITPRPNEEVRARVKAATGVDDACAVMGESFIQWVIEDHFCAGRPAWERVGAELVESVLPYEEAKIRILNSSHSCIAWAGTLAGLTYIHEGMAEPAIRRMAHDYISDDVIPCLTPSPLDLARYRDVVLERFTNPYIQDTNQRVAADGFAKIPGFIVPTLAERLAANAPVRSTAMLPALFYVFLQRWHHGNLPYAYQDGVMDERAAHAMLGAADPLAAFAGERLLWGGLAGQPALAAALRAAVQQVQAWLAARP